MSAWLPKRPPAGAVGPRAPVSAFRLRADHLLRRLWVGLLPPPPTGFHEAEAERIAHWCARFTRGILLRGNACAQPPP